MARPTYCAADHLQTGVGIIDALLARRVNGNGKRSIDNNAELFSNRTTSSFTAPSMLDGNSDG